MKKRIDPNVIFGAFLITMTIIPTVLLFFYPTNHAGAETMYVNVSEGSHLNGRAEPDKRSHVECRFYKGDEVNVLEIVDGWAKLDDGGEAEYSYVSLDYLIASPEGGTRMTVSSDGRVRVRTEPGGKVIDYVKNGDVVSVAFFFNGWANTNLGWIDGEYLEEGI